MRTLLTPIGWLLVIALLLAGTTASEARKKKKKGKPDKQEDLYAEYVWPPPPDEARIRLVEILRGRSDVEAESKLKKVLVGAGPQSPYDWLSKPFAAAYDPEGRLVVSDPVLGALLRFDREGRRLDVFGTRGALTLKTPLGLDIAPDGTIYAADAAQALVVAYTSEGKLVSVFGRGELENPTDATLSPDGERLYVADSKGQRVVIFDAASAELLKSFGERGEGEGQFNFPTSLAFGPEGNLFVVDQLNARVQIFTPDGEFYDQFGSLGTNYGNFVRPKDVAVDPFGFIYVSDGGLNNLQLFDIDLQLLTFLGSGGIGPGQFGVASGVAVHGDEFAVVDQLNRRVQIFRVIGGDS
jgi:DNA-binding beta-propeller fold protein YncE